MRESIIFGVLLQAKGLMALIIFYEALTADIISSRMYTILVVVVLVMICLESLSAKSFIVDELIYHISHRRFPVQIEENVSLISV